MKAIDALLPSADGLRWFNRMYLMVTQQVRDNPPSGTWLKPDWLDRLDVVFAGLYFQAIRDHLAGGVTPSSWAAFFNARFTPCIDRIQFAVAGMNAHINHDLALALLQTDAEFEIVPAPDGPEHADYLSVNTLLERLMPATLNMLAGDILGELAQGSGQMGRIMAFWNIARARDLAWDFANHIRPLSGPTRDAAIGFQDALTGALGHAILTQL